jgi:hypothetical protein
MASSNVNLVKMADPAIAGGDGYVFELDIHVVFGYRFAVLFSKHSGIILKLNWTGKHLRIGLCLDGLSIPSISLPR